MSVVFLAVVGKMLKAVEVSILHTYCMVGMLSLWTINLPNISSPGWCPGKTIYLFLFLSQHAGSIVDSMTPYGGYQRTIFFFYRHAHLLYKIMTRGQLSGASSYSRIRWEHHPCLLRYWTYQTSRTTLAILLWIAKYWRISINQWLEVARR